MHLKSDQNFTNELEMMRQSVDCASDSIFWVDRDGNIIYVNHAACAERGYTRDEMLSMKVFDLDPDYQAGIWEVHFEELKQKGTITLETRHRTKSGKEYPVEVSANYIHVGSKEFNFCFLRDITERKRNELAAAKALNTLEKIATRVPGVVYQFRIRPDGSSCFPFASEAIRRIYRVSPEEVREDAGKVFNVLHPDDVPEVVSSVEKSARELTLWQHEYRVRYADGTVRWLFGNAVPEREADGGTLWHGFITDITDRIRIEQLKTKFISTVSHELRTPLTSISGSLGLIVGGVLGAIPEPAAKIIDVAYRNSQRLTFLINDLLDMEKLEDGKMVFDMQRQDLLPLLEQSTESNSAYGSARNVSLSFAGSGLAELQVRVDSQRFLQIMSNLLSNAIKYSPENGTVTIVVNRHDDLVRVSVTDAGHGIPEQFHERIFQKFSQADSSDTRDKGGTGLGLAITKELVERMNGQIRFDSSAEQGTCFYFDLPLCPEGE